MQRGLRGIAGSPVRPYLEVTVNQNSDCWLTLTFLDRNNNPVIPVSATYRIDNLTSDTVVQSSTALPDPLASTYTLNIPGSINTINPQTGLGVSSQLNQLTVTATYQDGSVAEEVFPYEIIAIQTIGGAS